LHIGGLAPGRGYLNRADLTAEKFIPDGYGRRAGGRLYRSGDLARYLPDGNIEFIGRADNQVKVRGNRVELGEIEGVLEGHESVRESVVVARDDREGGKTIVAYVVGEEGEGVSATELKAYMREVLPEYMVASAVVVMESLPLTANGKVDRKALPAPEWERSDEVSAYVAPRDILEHQLAQIWKDVLGIKQVGIRDDFFELGGHSLLAVNLLAKVQQDFGKSPALGSLFDGGTIEHLAEIIREESGPIPANTSTVVKIQPGSKRPLFLVHPVGGNVLCYADLAHQLGPDQPVYAFQAVGMDGEQPPYASVEEMASRYVDDLRAVQPEGPYLLGGWSMGGVIAYEMARRLQAQGQQVDLLAMLDSKAPRPNQEEEELSEIELMAHFARDIGLDISGMVGSPDEFQGLQTDEILSRLLRRAIDSYLLPPYIGIEQVRHLFRVFTTNVAASRSYVPRESSCRIVLFKASEASRGADGDSAMGWGGLAANGVETHKVPGNHYAIVREPSVRVIAEQLTALLQGAEIRSE
jgi:thioesterase domain-containing protein